MKIFKIWMNNKTHSVRRNSHNNFLIKLKGELHSKMIFKGIKEGDNTLTSPLFIFISRVLVKDISPGIKNIVLIVPSS